MTGSDKGNEKLKNKIHPNRHLKQAVMKESNSSSEELIASYHISYRVLDHLLKSNSRTFQGPYEGYISEGARIEAPKAPRGVGSLGRRCPPSQPTTGSGGAS